MDNHVDPRIIGLSEHCAVLIYYANQAFAGTCIKRKLKMKIRSPRISSYRKGLLGDLHKKDRYCQKKKHKRFYSYVI